MDRSSTSVHQKLISNLSIGSAAPKDNSSPFDLPVVLARGNDSLGRSLKKQAIAVIALRTRLQDYSLALLLRNDETNHIRVGVFQRGMRDNFEFTRHAEWQVVKIHRDSIMEIGVRS